jgi:pimeloyl-ACP methyl ester carboxylesterase
MLTVDGTQLHYQRMGEGPPLVLLHSGHFPFVEQPGEFFPLITDFLTRSIQ